MALFKCKMCGGALEITNNETVATCEYCGTQQTLPRLNDDRKANLYDRANHFRRNNEFDKAMGIYEQILTEDSTDAEAYWSLVLCRYGIEYVEDPSSRKRIPTVNRAQFTSVFDDDNYKSALQHADGYQRSIYEGEAKTINEIQKGILAISQKEEPFDVFICYKESDSSSRRTPDSVLANDLYHQLTQEGFKVFFARITLEDKLGSAYEPYIFAALNSAKVMVVLGTKPEYFKAVWVRNEWSRYLALIKQGQKKMLIPAYKDMDPYDLPEEFSHLQAQDMGKLGFMQDLIRGIKKITQTETTQATIVKETVVTTGNGNTAPLLKRAFMFLEDGDWNSADEYCEKVLDLDPECAQAYLGKLMAELKVRKQENLKDCAEPFDDKNNCQKAVRFADNGLKAALTGYIEHINTRNENARVEGIYIRAKKAMSEATSESAYRSAAQLFESVHEYLDSAPLAEECYEKAEVERKDTIYWNAMDIVDRRVNTIAALEKAIKEFQSISGWKDADQKIDVCNKRIDEIKAKEEVNRLERERKAEIAHKEAERAAKRNKIIAIITVFVVCAVVAFVVFYNTNIVPNNKYHNAVALMDAGEYVEALSIFSELGDYKDSTDKLQQIWDEIAVRNTIAVGYKHVVGLKTNGTVVAVGENEKGQCNVFGWTDIVAVEAGCDYTVGLKEDGTVVIAGKPLFVQDDGILEWKNIVAISSSYNHTLGLKADGTVVAYGTNYDGECNVSGWENIIAVAAGTSHSVGLKADGTVVAVGKNTSAISVHHWRDIVAISAGSVYTMGIKADGTVVLAGSIAAYSHNTNIGNNDEAKRWTDIVAVGAGWYHAVGLKKDGTLVAVGYNSEGESNVFGWKNVIAIAAGASNTIGLKSDGSVVIVGSNDDWQLNAAHWKNIKVN